MHLFQRLPNETLSRIVNELYVEECPSSIYSLLFIRPFKKFAERVLYKLVNLKGPYPGSQQDWKYTQLKIDHILGQNDVSEHVRELVIEKWTGTVWPPFDDSVLVKVLENLRSLDSFTWDSERFIPKIVLALLHSRFPNARLCVINTSRGQGISSRDRDMVMDIDLLTSPQLYSLEYTLFAEADIPRRSELPIMARIIENSRRLRILRFVCKPNRNYHFDDYYGFYLQFDTDGRSNQNLPFTIYSLDEVLLLQMSAEAAIMRRGVKNQLEPLQELRFLSDPSRMETFYDFTVSHCLLWRSCMDWGKLQTLDLGGQGSKDFFEVFQGHVPNLKSFSFTLVRGESYGVDNVRIIGKFLDSINGLEELVVRNATDGFFPVIWEYVKKYDSTLRTLKTSCIMRSTKLWTEKPLLELHKSLPQLKELSIDIDQSTETYRILTKFDNLQILSIRMRADNNSFSTSGAEPTQRLATELFVGVFRNNIQSRLKELRVESREWKQIHFDDVRCEIIVVTVKRMKRDDAPSPVDGGFDIVVE